MVKDLEAPCNYAVVERKKLIKMLRRGGIYSFGKNRQHIVKSDLTIYLDDQPYCKCKDIDEVLSVINYYF